MGYNFERWTGKGHHSQGRGCACYVTFGRSQMYVSTRLLTIEGTKDGRFDLMVDAENRVFALRFSEQGGLKLPSIPGQVGVGSFVGDIKPLLGQRIPMTKDISTGLWVGHLDGGKVDMSKMGEKA